MNFIPLWFTMQPATPVEMLPGQSYEAAFIEELESDKDLVAYSNVKIDDSRLQQFVDVFEQRENRHFIGKANTSLPYYSFWNQETQRREAQPFVLTDASGNSVEESSCIPQARDGVKNVVVVISYVDKNTKEVYMATHRHEEGNIFGYPDIFDAPPGGRIDPGHSSLTTALTEAYEELGYQAPIKAGDCLAGYIHHEINLFLFFLIQEKHLKETPNVMESYQMGFTPFTLRVITDHDKLKSELERISTSYPAKEWVNEVFKVKKACSQKVLFPRPIGLFDSVSVTMAKVDFGNTLALVNDSPGRFCSFVHGFPVWLGLARIRSSTKFST